MKKVIVVLGCIIDTLHFEDIWREFSRTTYVDVHGDEWSMQFLFHAKYIVKAKASSQWVADRLISVSYKPEYGSFEVALAFHRLVCEANNIPDVQHVVFVTESCLPIGSLERWVKLLLEDSNSWVFVTYPGIYSRLHRIEGLGLDKREMIKSHTCNQLNKRHIQMLSGLSQEGSFFAQLSRVSITADELWVGSALKLFRELDVDENVDHGPSKRIIPSSINALGGSRALRRLEKRKCVNSGNTQTNSEEGYPMRWIGCNYRGSQIQSETVSCRRVCAFFQKPCKKTVPGLKTIERSDILVVEREGSLTARKYDKCITLEQWRTAHKATDTECKSID